jgi:hypothetical protein
MMDFASTHAQAKEVAPSSSHDGGPTEAAAAKPTSTSPLPIADGVDKLYHQLAEIHIIATIQLAECALLHRSDPTPSPVWVGTAW